MAEMYFCIHCIAKKVRINLIQTINSYYRRHNGNDWEDFLSIYKMGGKCALCGAQNDNTQAIKHPQMEQFVDDK